MSLDLTQAPDHPAKIISQWVAEKIEPVYPAIAGNVARQTAVLLREHEVDHGVVFAALDRKTLVAVQEAYAALDGATDIGATRDFEVAVRDLLGLDDE